ncbi:MAG: hypothetical protein AAFP69_22955, partial [Planctomycetota bacterium]
MASPSAGIEIVRDDLEIRPEEKAPRKESSVGDSSAQNDGTNATSSSPRGSDQVESFLVRLLQDPSLLPNSDAATLRFSLLATRRSPLANLDASETNAQRRTRAFSMPLPSFRPMQNRGIVQSVSMTVQTAKEFALVADMPRCVAVRPMANNGNDVDPDKSLLPDETDDLQWRFDVDPTHQMPQLAGFLPPRRPQIGLDARYIVALQGDAIRLVSEFRIAAGAGLNGRLPISVALEDKQPEQAEGADVLDDSLAPDQLTEIDQWTVTVDDTPALVRRESDGTIAVISPLLRSGRHRVVIESRIPVPLTMLVGEADSEEASPVDVVEDGSSPVNGGPETESPNMGSNRWNVLLPRPSDDVLNWVGDVRLRLLGNREITPRLDRESTFTDWPANRLFASTPNRDVESTRKIADDAGDSSAGSQSTEDDWPLDVVDPNAERIEYRLQQLPRRGVKIRLSRNDVT